MTNKQNIVKQAINSDIKAMDAIVDWSKVFPRNGRPDLRKKQTKYTIGKIKELRRDIIAQGGAPALRGKDSAFRPMCKSKLRDDAQQQMGVNPIYRGIFFPNPNVEISIRRIKGAIKIEQKSKRTGKQLADMIPEDFHETPTSPEHLRELIEGMTPKGNPDIVAIKNGEFQMHAWGVNEMNHFIDEAALLYSKYESLAVSGEVRQRKRKRKGKTIIENDKYNHPREWIRGVWWIKRQKALKK